MVIGILLCFSFIGDLLRDCRRLLRSHLRDCHPWNRPWNCVNCQRRKTNYATGWCCEKRN